MNLEKYNVNAKRKSIRFTSNYFQLTKYLIYVCLRKNRKCLSSTVIKNRKSIIRDQYKLFRDFVNQLKHPQDYQTQDRYTPLLFSLYSPNHLHLYWFVCFWPVHRFINSVLVSAKLSELHLHPIQLLAKSIKAARKSDEIPEETFIFLFLKCLPEYPQSVLLIAVINKILFSFNQ